MAGKRGSLPMMFDVRPELRSEWAYELNTNVDPELLSSGSGKGVWWICPSNPVHVYKSPPGARCRKPKGTNCPYCARQKVHESESLKTQCPDVMEWWDWSKNTIDPEQILPGSNKTVWWKCAEGHSWSNQVQKIAIRGQGCPYCSGRKASPTNNIRVTHPHLLDEWDFTKNKITPDEVTSGSSTKVHWKCESGPDHEWTTTPAMRISQGTGCPFCANLRVSVTNSLESLFPEVSTQWCGLRNGSTTPADVVYGSDKKFWWQCEIHEEHVWETTVYSRTIEKSGCPKCNPRKSRPEIRVFTEFRYLFPDCESGAKVHGKELDIWLPSLSIGIEYDGSFWHRSKTEKDVDKNKFFSNHGITVIRMREPPLEKLSENDVLISEGELTKDDIDRLMKSICSVTPEVIDTCSPYLGSDEFLNDDLYQTYLSYFPSPFPEHSLATKDPISLEYWDFEKNFPLTPENFSLYSDYDAWWICTVNNAHTWQKNLRYRKIGESCPICAKEGKVRDLVKRRQKKSRTQNLFDENGLMISDLYPHLVAEWSTKNEFPIDHYSAGSGFKGLWICSNNHEWRTPIFSRTGRNSGCPVCRGQKPEQGEGLLVKFPSLKRIWDYELNKDINPNLLVTGSAKKVWWRCPVAEDHVWKSEVRILTKKTDNHCPFCEKERASSTYNLSTEKPNVSVFWIEDLNDRLPSDVLPNSTFFAWWRCPSNSSHVYRAKVCNRVRHVGCPTCGRRTKHPDDSV